MNSTDHETNKSLEDAFDEAMRNVYRSAKSDCNYTATRFHNMVCSIGGVAAAKKLLASPNFPTGLSELAACQCLHLSMEALVLDEKWATLFSETERTIARRRIT
jgi:hypothetical protein